MVSVLIYAGDGENVERVCPGPSGAGVCNHPPGTPLPCAGRLITVLSGGNREPIELAVEPGATICPLAALGFARREVDADAARPGQERPDTLGGSPRRRSPRSRR